jgi:[lysine-biosynthesis-protein LysW]---L-2-aminoadipate ligase
MRIGLLHTGIRGDEKLILEAAQSKKIEIVPIDARKVVLNPNEISYWQSFDVILERCISSIRGNSIIEFLSNLGINVVNDKNVMAICNDKFQTSTILSLHNVPNLRSILVFDEEQAKQAVAILGGYPIVLKSRQGSWGRLMGKISDDNALESIFDHRKYMGPEQSAVVIQEYVQKPQGRDIRAFVIDGHCICAIYRTSPHWITNTARGGIASNCEVTTELHTLCKQASDAVGGGILAMDVFETDDGLKINEINHTMEFKNSEAPTGVSISGAIIDYCQKVSQK